MLIGPLICELDSAREQVAKHLSNPAGVTDKNIGNPLSLFILEKSKRLSYAIKTNLILQGDCKS